MTKAEIPAFVARALERPARWAPAGSMLPAYDGWERTLQVFNTGAREQIGMLERLEEHRTLLENAAGGPLVIIFLSVAQSQKHLEGMPLAER